MKNYIVLDLEWNQSSEGKENSLEHLPFEIIEIGAVRLNEDFEETGSFQRLIKPVIYPELHYKISEVTHMEMEELEQAGTGFKEAVEEFIEWCGENFILCTWGSMDLTELQRNMAYYGVANPYGMPLMYYDIQKLYSLLHSDGKTRQSLDLVIEELGFLKDWQFHRALYDARYTSLVMKKMDFHSVIEYQSVDYYRLPSCPEEEVYLVFPDYSKFISREFETKEDAISNKKVTDLICCRCNRMLHKKLKWFSVNQRYYYALGSCPEHGCVRGKIRMKKSEAGHIYVVKTMKPVDLEGECLVYEKQEESRKRRVEKMRMRKVHKREKREE